ncbi:MAG: c-type cytochrome [Nitrospirales bacterium]
MPRGWWTDEKIIEEGRQIFLGKKDIDVNCASCHGRDGKPVKAGARDFRVTERMELYSDSVWFWRISEGVPNTKMKAWKSKLAEEDRWKVLAFERTFGLDGKKYDPVANAWVPNEQPFAKAGAVTGKNQAGKGQAEKMSSDQASDGAPADQATGAAPAGQPAKAGTN